ncbi:hypothetical protein OUZ56_011569 [Daphnia magna]|uniref:Uncharacterized protein n=1 Tax=Daphnia magna TaxID=35525 RepID=A0ABQ9Z0Q9_9CRUS|nr:hypothetical protein OUZ56_011569 [Daphnia magna]
MGHESNKRLLSQTGYQTMLDMEKYTDGLCPRSTKIATVQNPHMKRTNRTFHFATTQKRSQANKLQWLPKVSERAREPYGKRRFSRRS